MSVFEEMQRAIAAEGIEARAVKFSADEDSDEDSDDNGFILIPNEGDEIDEQALSIFEEDRRNEAREILRIDGELSDED